MEEILTLGILLDYLYNKFAITFLMCLIGAVIRETMGTVNKCTMINIKKILCGTVFSTCLMCALADYVKVPFSIYIFICIIVGIWSFKLIKLVLSAKFINIFLKNLLKTFTDPLSKALSKTAEDMDDSKKKIKEKQEDKNINENEDTEDKSLK